MNGALERHFRTALWNGRLERRFGTKIGTAFWNGVLERKFGTELWNGALERRFGTARLKIPLELDVGIGSGKAGTGREWKVGREQLGAGGTELRNGTLERTLERNFGTEGWNGTLEKSHWNRPLERAFRRRRRKLLFGRHGTESWNETALKLEILAGFHSNAETRIWRRFFVDIVLNSIWFALHDAETEQKNTRETFNRKQDTRRATTVTISE